MRTHTRELVVDAGLFNQHQLQPRELLRHLMQGSFGWMAEHVVSYPELVEAHGYGFVYMTVELEYLDDLAFTDAERLRYDTAMTLMRQGTRLLADLRFRADDREIVRLSSLLAIVQIQESAATSARPAPLSEALQARFLDDECSDAKLERRMPAHLVEAQSGTAIVRGAATPFTVSRHHCEFADQWVFFEIPTLYEPAREGLVLQQGRARPTLKGGLSKPLRSVSVELNRPFFAFDCGSVRTDAYEVPGGLRYVHRLESELPVGAVHATIVERF